ncbi:MAG: fibronectin type III domain-containing protein [Euryarchaeota archaeon]|nr:fibronectin type III domain-containing protein [Euryarchaeota archaeon]
MVWQSPAARRLASGPSTGADLAWGPALLLAALLFPGAWGTSGASVHFAVESGAPASLPGAPAWVERPQLPPDPGTGGWVSCSNYISCGSGLAWEIDSGGFQVSGYGYPSSGSDYSFSQAQSDIRWELSTYGNMISTVSTHYGVPEINIVTETGPETSFGTDGVNDIMQDLSSSWCGGGAGSQSPDSWALNYANSNWGSCSSSWIHFISFAAGTNYLGYESNRYGASFDPGVLGPSYNAGSLVYTTTYSCSGQYDAWHLVMCSGGGLTASYSWNIAVAYNAALTVGGGGMSSSYGMKDTTTGSSLSCGGTFNTGDNIQFTGTVSGGQSPYSWAWSFGDGGTGSGNPANHVYSAPGTVTPLLTVTDSSGNTATTGQGCSFNVIGLSVSMSIFDLTTGRSVNCGDSVNTLDTLRFTAAVTGGTSPYTYAWSFGDGTTGSGNPANHVYTALGTVNPTVKVTDSRGQSSTAGQGCNLKIIGTPVTFYTLPSTVGVITVGSSSFTNGQSQAFPGGATFPMSVSAPSGYVFSGWSSTGSVSVGSATNPSTTLTITGSSPATVTVSFVTRTAITFVSFPANAASVEIGGSTYSSGQNVTASVGTPYPLLAVPNPGFVFVQWQVTGSGMSVQSLNQAYTNLTVLSSSPSTLTEVVLYNVPRAPAGLSVTGETTTSISLAWTPPPGTLISYALGYSAGGSPPTGGQGGFQIATLGGASTTYSFGGLTPATQYWLALAGVNSTGQGQWSVWVTGTTLALPQPPLYLTVGEVGPGYAVLSWQLPTAGSSIGSYTLNCTSSSAGASPRVIGSIPPASTVYNVTGLSPSAFYSCFMFSRAGAYSSVPSNTVSFTEPASPPAAAAHGGPPGWLPGPLSILYPTSLVGVLDLALLGVLSVLAALLVRYRRGRSRRGPPTSSSQRAEPEEPVEGSASSMQVAPEAVPSTTPEPGAGSAFQSQHDAPGSEPAEG